MAPNPSGAAASNVTRARTQPVPAPGSVTALEELLAAGVLVDLAGRPLRARPCGHCGASTVGETCPWSLRCPGCGAGPGSPCRRPSGHNAAELHTGRVAAAAEIDVRRELDGDPTLPAPWPPGPR